MLKSCKSVIFCHLLPVKSKRDREGETGKDREIKRAGEGEKRERDESYMRFRFLPGHWAWS